MNEQLIPKLPALDSEIVATARKLSHFLDQANANNDMLPYFLGAGIVAFVLVALYYGRELLRTR